MKWSVLKIHVYEIPKLTVAFLLQANTKGKFQSLKIWVQGWCLEKEAYITFFLISSLVVRMSESENIKMLFSRYISACVNLWHKSYFIEQSTFDTQTSSAYSNIG